MSNFKKNLAGLLFMLLFLCLYLPADSGAEDYPASLPGTYRNLSFNVDGAGGAQRFMPALVLYPDHQYAWGREKGRWEIENNTLKLSGRPAWGGATINKSGQLVFEFVKEGKHYTVTMYRAGDATNSQVRSYA